MYEKKQKRNVQAKIIACLVGVSLATCAVSITVDNAYQNHKTKQENTAQTIEISTTMKYSPAKEKHIIYDIPMSVDEQVAVWDNALKYEICPYIVFGIIEVESNFNQSCVSNDTDYGLMQISKINFNELKEHHIDNVATNGIQNIKGGCYLLAKSYGQHYSNNEALMRYNIGHSGAYKLFEQGITQTEYTKKVIQSAERFAKLDGGKIYERNKQ